jgi:HSP20 family molecular chaperone IbpA
MQRNHKESRSEPGDTVGLTLKVGSALADLAEQIQQDIGRRAYELFEQRGYTHGDDLSDWFQAEKEIVQNVHSEVKDAGKQISLRVDVSNFDLANLQVGLYPRRLIVWGKRLATSGKNGDSADQDPKYLVTLSLVDLPIDVDMQNAKAVVKGTEIEVIAEKAHM